MSTLHFVMMPAELHREVIPAGILSNTSLGMPSPQRQLLLDISRRHHGIDSTVLAGAAISAN
jgi:hypothetical protein